jgi:hypothetical protein
VLKEGIPATMGTGERHYYSLDEREFDSPRKILALGAMLDVLISGGTCHDSVQVCKSEVEQEDSNDRFFSCDDVKYFSITSTKRRRMRSMITSFDRTILICPGTIKLWKSRPKVTLTFRETVPSLTRIRLLEKST